MNNWERRKRSYENYEKNNLNEKENCKLSNLKRKKNSAWKKLNKNKDSLIETWHLKGWGWN